MLYLWLALMVLGLIGLLFCRKRSRPGFAVKIAAGLCLALVVFGGIMLAREFSAGNINRNADLKQDAFVKAQGFVLGKRFAADGYSGQVLLIAEPGEEEAARTGAFADGILAGLNGPGSVVVDAVEIPGYEGRQVAYVMKAEHLDGLIARYPDAGRIVSIVGLPSDCLKMKTLTQHSRPGFYVQNALDDTVCAELLKRKLIDGYITFKFPPDVNADATSDMEANFNLRYVLIE